MWHRTSVPCLAFLASLTAACSNPVPPPVGDVNAFSDRVTREWVGAIVRLKTPPLASLATWNKGKPVLRPAQIKALLDEQASVEASLKALSPDIEVLFRYRNLYNGLAIVAPRRLASAIEAIPGITRVLPDPWVERPSPHLQQESRNLLADTLMRSPARFIGAPALWKLGIRGAGIRVGILDTGIDYTHAMLGGPGTPEAFRAISPDTLTPGTFPTARVVGGYDFAGSNPWADRAKPPLPKPDPNPIDEAGHGTHVAGIVAGHGDGQKTYDGVAPEASLYAIKVFGAEGGTPGSSLLAGLDYSVDPNGDFDLGDRLDVVNISLGTGFGTIFEDDAEIFANARNTGMIFVAAAGNDGSVPFIVGNPASANDYVLAVAAGLDDEEIHWRFPNSRFVLPTGENLDVRTYAALFGAQITPESHVSGPLVPLGLAATELTPEQREAVRGKIALLDRGEVSFFEKAKRVEEAGAIGFVMVDNVPGEAPFTMTTSEETEKVAIPGVMVGYEVGERVKAALARGMVRFEFHVPTFTETPEAIDTVADFSSRGPRSLDGLIKPEIVAPGHLVTSAAMGTGNEGVAYSGTSMASPVMAGAMALLRQAFPFSSVQELRARTMNTAQIIKKASGEREDVALQGAGRVALANAISARLLTTPQTVSLGLVTPGQHGLSARMTVENPSSQALRFQISSSLDIGLKLTSPQGVLSVPPNGRVDLLLQFEFDAPTERTTFTERDGFLALTSPDGTTTYATLPVLAEAHRGSEIVRERNQSDRRVVLRNASIQESGDVGVFRLLGTSPLLPPPSQRGHGNPCDLRAVGFRVVSRQVTSANGLIQTKDMLQFGALTATPLTSGEHCELSVRFDDDGDGSAEWELVGADLGDYTTDPKDWGKWSGILFDAHKMQDLAQSYLSQIITNPNTRLIEDYTPAVRALGDYTLYKGASLQLVETDLDFLRNNGSRKRLLVAMQPMRAQFADDDFLGENAAEGKWYPFSLNALPPVETQEWHELPAGQTLDLGTLPPGSVVFLPHNRRQAENLSGRPPLAQAVVVP